jgi:hypothetical protein
VQHSRSYKWHDSPLELHAAACLAQPFFYMLPLLSFEGYCTRKTRPRFWLHFAHACEDFIPLDRQIWGGARCAARLLWGQCGIYLCGLLPAFVFHGFSREEHRNAAVYGRDLIRRVAKRCCHESWEWNGCWGMTESDMPRRFREWSPCPYHSYNCFFLRPVTTKSPQRERYENIIDVLVNHSPQARACKGLYAAGLLHDFSCFHSSCFLFLFHSITLFL